MNARRVRAWVTYSSIALALALLTAGCALDPLHARRAAATAAAAQSHQLDCAAEREDHCAIASPYQELADTALAQSTSAEPRHYVNLLERGTDALLLRVHLIRSARTSIVVQTFIFQDDDAGSLILDELVKAARRGVKVRVIADQLFSLENTHLLAALAHAHENFELRVYNPTFYKAATPPLEFAAGLLCCFWRFNQRMHDKMLLIDDEIGIVGGRNYENRYYDWDDDFDYRDRDVLAAGPVGARMRAAFDTFWNDPHTVPLTHLRDVAHDILAGGIRAPAYVTHPYRDPMRVETLSRQADDVDYIRSRFANTAMRVGRVEYFADAPGKPAAQAPFGVHESTRQLMSLLRSAQEEVVLQTPYLVLSKSARKLFADLRQSKTPPHVIVSTNSLAATDAFYVYALSYKYKKRYLKLGFEIHEFKPFPDEAAEMVSDYASLGGGLHTVSVQPKRRARYSSAPLKRAGVRLGLHAKSFVVDGAVAVIGSHNFDPRSEEYNTEAGFIIYDREFASRLRESILRDAAPENSWTIARRRRAPLFGPVSNALANISAALPIFDFWPFRYATSYEFDPDNPAACTPPPPPGAENFNACFVDVGDFPEVDLPLKTIYTRIVTAFGAGLASIM
jgi:phosphatidylserine/phosphatidylglycerophosphate/cardiolipin synthase-like enzyme